MILPISQTATFTDLFNKLNEVISSLNTTESQIGNLDDLETLADDSLVAAINERSGIRKQVTSLILLLQ